jgi:CheY-like chemotaxis protein
MTNRKVLIADDEGAVRSLLRAPLEQAGFEIIEAADGREAAELALSERPGLLLLDIMMPRADGFEVMRRLRADPLTAAIPVVLLSGRPAEVRDYQAIHAGSDLFQTDDIALVVIKPLLTDASELVPALDRILATGSP